MDSHQYLHQDSCHAEHIHKSIISNQILGLRRICSEIKDLKSHGGWFLRGYPQRRVKEQVNQKFKLPSEHHTLQNKKENVIPLVTYNPALRDLSTALWEKL